MNIPFQESGMVFGPWPEGHCCFRIEKSDVYLSMRNNNVKMAEFLLLKPTEKNPFAVWVVEAKSSTPRPETQPNFDHFIDEIREKWTNALLLCLAMHMQRLDNRQLPESFKQLDMGRVSFKLILIISGYKEGWLSGLQSALSLALRHVCKTMSDIEVLVLNDDLAVKHGLIQS